MRADELLKQLVAPIFNPRRTSEIFNYSPTGVQERSYADVSTMYVYSYNSNELFHCELNAEKELDAVPKNDRTKWINIDGLSKEVVEKVAGHFSIHPLLTEDILSLGQRPKMDEMDGVLFCVMNMLYWNEEKNVVEQEQISMVLGQSFVITFQEDKHRDVFNSIREKLKNPQSKLRNRHADYLYYSLIDMIVDHYFVVLEQLTNKIEDLEDEIVRVSNKKTLAKIISFKKELIVLKRNVMPVRDLLNSLIRSESELLGEQLNRYFKDVLDHIIQAGDVVENYRDITSTFQDLYLSQVNLRMNEVMKVMAIATCLLAPATIIGGIFGMNFDVIPIAHQQYGFWIAVGMMVVIPILMLRWFKFKRWF